MTAVALPAWTITLGINPELDKLSADDSRGLCTAGPSFLRWARYPRKPPTRHRAPGRESGSKLGNATPVTRQAGGTQ